MTKTGILYCLKNILWLNYKKCGVTTQLITKRISNLQTSLFYDCEIVYTTNNLINPHYYEYLLKKILSKYRLRNDREFFDIDVDNIKSIFDFFNELNTKYNTENLLNEYIKMYDKEYYLKIFKKIYVERVESKQNYSLIKKRKIFIDTSNL